METTPAPIFYNITDIAPDRFSALREAIYSNVDVILHVKKVKVKERTLRTEASALSDAILHPKNMKTQK